MILEGGKMIAFGDVDEVAQVYAEMTGELEDVYKRQDYRVLWEMMNRRWDIEENGFHQLKTYYHAKHCYCHDAVETLSLIHIWYKMYVPELEDKFWNRGNWAVIGMYALVLFFFILSLIHIFCTALYYALILNLPYFSSRKMISLAAGLLIIFNAFNVDLSLIHILSAIWMVWYRKV